MGKKRGKKQNFIKISTKVSGFEGGEKAKLYYKGTGSIIEIARFFKASDGFQFVKNKDDYRSKKPISELEIGIAVRMSCK